MTDTGVRNVFILSVDSLSYAYFSTYADAIAEQLDAVNFRNAIAPSSNTRCSAPAFHAGIFSDSDLLEMPPIRIPESGAVTTVAEQFHAGGYETGFWTPNHIFGNANNYDRGFVHGNKGATQSNKQIADFLQKYGTERLFDLAQTVYFHGIKPIAGKLQRREGYVWSPAPDIQNATLEWFEANDSNPIFCWLHYMDTHHPFEPPAEYLDKMSWNKEWDRGELSFFTRDAIKKNADGLTAEEIEDIETAYKASCMYLGEQMQAFIDVLEERSYYDPEQDLLCVTADHGEAFTPEKHNLMGHASFFEEIVRVPLIISHPEWDAQTVDDQVSLIDLMPTVMNAAGLSIPGTFAGRPCRSPTEMAREYAYVIDGNPKRRCIRGNGHKLFGHRVAEDSYEVVFTEYEPGAAVEETIHFRKHLDEWDDTDRDELPSVCRTLYEQLQTDHGEPIEENPAYLPPES